MLDADTITDAQVNEVWLLGCEEDNPDLLRVAAVARNGWRGYTTVEQREARASCAEIINKRRQETAR